LRWECGGKYVSAKNQMVMKVRREIGWAELDVVAAAARRLDFLILVETVKVFCREEPTVFTILPRPLRALGAAQRPRTQIAAMAVGRRRSAAWRVMLRIIELNPMQNL